MGITRAADGTNWVIEFVYRGMRYRRSSGTSDAAAARLIEANWRLWLREEAEFGRSGVASELTLDEAITKYITTVVKPSQARRRGGSTVGCALRRIRSHFGGGTLLRSITKEKLLAFRAALVAEELSASTAAPGDGGDLPPALALPGGLPARLDAALGDHPRTGVGSTEGSDEAGQSRLVSRADLPEAIRAAVDSLGAHAASPALQDVIARLCAWRDLTRQDLAEILGRSPDYLRAHLRILVDGGRLVLRFPDHPRHRQQAYRSTQRPSTP